MALEINYKESYVYEVRKMMRMRRMLKVRRMLNMRKIDAHLYGTVSLRLLLGSIFFIFYICVRSHYFVFIVVRLRDNHAKKG